jgi:hypothetical protein
MKSGLTKLAVAVAVVLAVGCGGGDDKKDNPTGRNGGGGGGTAGKFIVTGIPSEYNGKYAMAVGSDESIGLFGLKNASFIPLHEYTLVQIANGRVSLPMWTVSSDGNSLTAYTGNYTIEYFTLAIYENEIASYTANVPPIAQLLFSSVKFSNGGATRAWPQG